MLWYAAKVCSGKIDRDVSPSLPIGFGCQRLRLANCKDCLSLVDCGSESCNSFRDFGVVEAFSRNSLLTDELMRNQFFCDLYGCSRLFCKSLRTPEPRIGGPDWTGCCEDRAVAIQHHKSCVLVGKPAERGKRNHSIGANYHEATQTVAHAGQARLAPVSSDPVLNG
jgi:hypothetical protein